MADTLRPGEFIWFGDGFPVGPVEVVLSYGRQMAYVFRSGQFIGAATISSGIKGRESPIGRFQILEKRKIYRSIRYDNAPMPWMMRLNWYGVAMHGGHNPGYAASHGCIRLPVAFAQKLFTIADVGSFVYATNDSVIWPEDALALARANYENEMPDHRLPRGASEAVAYAEQDLPYPQPGPSYAQRVQAEPASAPARSNERAAKPKRSFWERIF
jgi:L,D-transpeptidase-like protein